MATLTRVQLPDIPLPQELPVLPIEEYRRRWDSLIGRMVAERLDFLVVYADREHFANLSFLTGFDPRFEEALLLADRHGNRKLLLGNECVGDFQDPGLEIKVELFQDFSLLDQPRSQSRPLVEILREFGIRENASVGSVGWKYFDDALVGEGDYALEIPSYIADTLRALVGDRKGVRNATSLFMNARDGLRLENCVHQIAQFEYASSYCSASVKSFVQSLHVGDREYSAARNLDGGGLPLSCHTMTSFGEKVRRGLSSPSHNKAKLGDPYTVAFGVQGGLTCRAGTVARSAADLSLELRDFYPQFAKSYFTTVVEWYRHIRVGVLCGEIFDLVEAQCDKSLFGLALNPGHHIHLDEWVSSPFYHGSQIVLRSGMALQADMIPVSHGPFCYANMEDGVVLADESLRLEIQAYYPDVWSRIQTRRQFMLDVIGIPIDQSVLPLSNITGWLPPFALEPDIALTVS